MSELWNCCETHTGRTCTAVRITFTARSSPAARKHVLPTPSFCSNCTIHERVWTNLRLSLDTCIFSFSRNEIECLLQIWHICCAGEEWALSARIFFRRSTLEKKIEKRTRTRWQIFFSSWHFTHLASVLCQTTSTCKTNRKPLRPPELQVKLCFCKYWSKMLSPACHVLYCTCKDWIFCVCMGYAWHSLRDNLTSQALVVSFFVSIAPISFWLPTKSQLHNFPCTEQAKLTIDALSAFCLAPTLTICSVQCHLINLGVILLRVQPVFQAYPFSQAISQRPNRSKEFVLPEKPITQFKSIPVISMLW